MIFDAKFAAAHDRWLNPPLDYPHLLECPQHEDNDGNGDCDCEARIEDILAEQAEDRE